MTQANLFIPFNSCTELLVRLSLLSSSLSVVKTFLIGAAGSGDLFRDISGNVTTLEFRNTFGSRFVIFTFSNCDARDDDNPSLGGDSNIRPSSEATTFTFPCAVV